MGSLYHNDYHLDKRYRNGRDTRPNPIKATPCGGEYILRQNVNAFSFLQTNVNESSP